MSLRGCFIALEGIDGAGTTTQSKELQQRLREVGVPFIQTAEPSAGEVGRLIRKRLGDVETPPDPASMALLFAADRLDHWRDEIDPALSRGHWVISDRYVWSSLSYQSQTHPLSWVQSLNKHAPQPHLTILVDVDPKETGRRLGVEGRKKEIYDDLELQKSIRRVYLELLSQADAERAVKVDGSQGVGEVAEDIWRAVSERLYSSWTSKETGR